MSSRGGTKTALERQVRRLAQRQGFSLLTLAPQMQPLTGSHLKMPTLADAAVQNITIPGYPGLQDANYIYVPNLQQAVNSAFYGSAAVKAAKPVTVDVCNGSGAPGLAGAVSQAFAAAGYATGKAGSASAQPQQLQGDTQVFYGATTVTEQDFVTAAQQDHLPASEIPPATAPGTTAGTQSLSATRVGARAVAPARQAAPAHPASTPSAANVKRPADVPAGVPCVY